MGSLNGDANLVDESVELYREVVDMMPHGWMLLDRLAEVYVRVGQPEAALPVLEKSLAIIGQTGEAARPLTIRAAAYGGLGQYDLAIEQMNAVISVWPSERAYNERAVIYYEMGDFDSALEDYNRAINAAIEAQEVAVDKSGSKAQAPEAYVGRALAYTQLGRDAEAEQDVENAVKQGFDGELLRRVIEEIKSSR
jgi:tetratricopeptide (TPR) repeat protein